MQQSRECLPTLFICNDLQVAQNIQDAGKFPHLSPVQVAISTSDIRDLYPALAPTYDSSAKGHYSVRELYKKFPTVIIVLLSNNANPQDSLLRSMLELEHSDTEEDDQSDKSRSIFQPEEVDDFIARHERLEPKGPEVIIFRILEASMARGLAKLAYVLAEDNDESENPTAV